MKTPLISVCVPTYNRPEYLRTALLSCLGQTLRDFEVIVTDNGRDEAAERVVRELGDPAVRYVRNEANLGGLRNLEKARTLARGKYVKFLMDDDVLRRDCLEKMAAALEANPRAGVAMAPLSIIDHAGRPARPVFYLVRRMMHLYRYRRGSGPVDKRAIMRDFLTRVYPCCVPTGLMFRREGFERLGGFDFEADFAIDVEICMRFALEYDFYYIDEPLASWRFNASSDTVQMHKNGLKNQVFYWMTEKYLADARVVAGLPARERDELRRTAYLFASKRSLLGIVSGLRNAAPAAVAGAVRSIVKGDPYPSNVAKLPFVAASEVLKGLFSWFEVDTF